MFASGSLANHDQVKHFHFIADFEASTRARARRSGRPSARSRYRNPVFLQAMRWGSFPADRWPRFGSTSSLGHDDPWRRAYAGPCLREWRDA